MKMNAWIYLLLAGLFEIGFTSMMKLSNGFSLDRWPYLIGFFVSAALSFSLLGKVMQIIPLGTAYAVWTGIGAAGTAVVGMMFFKDPVTLGRVFFLCTLIGSVIGLKMVSPE